MKLSPSWLSHRSMHVKLSKPNTQDLVTVNRQIRAADISMHCESDLRGVRVLLSTDLHLSFVEEDVPGIEGSLVVAVCWMGSECKTSFHDDGIQHRCRVNID